MTRRGQYACVLAGLLICLALTIGFGGSRQPVRKPQPAGGDDIPFPTWEPTSIVPEGVAVLVVAIIWTAGRALLSGRLGHHLVRHVPGTLVCSHASAGGAAAHTQSRRRSFG
jgi:hypothetical protein